MTIRRLALGALLFSLAMPLYFMAAALGVKFGLWGWRLGLGTLIVEWGPRLLGIAALLALAILGASVFRRDRRASAAALVALLIPAIGLFHLYQLRSRSESIPPIHDVATNIEDPPGHSPRTRTARADAGANPIHPLTAKLSTIPAYQGPRFADLADRSVGDLGREAYPQLRPLTLAVDRPRLFAVLEEQARQRGWTIVSNDPAAGRFEAVAESFWFGFEDDVVVRVRSAAAPGRLVVDARSTSRVGLSDLGANAARLTDYLHAVETQVSGRR